MSPLLQVTILFGKLSLLAVGGVNATLPAVAREVVEQRHWMTAHQFSQLFAIAQAVPGPNMLVVALIGQREAGLAGGLIATAATVLPAGVLVLLVSHFWHRFQGARWRQIIQRAMLPISGGLMLSAAYVLVRAADNWWLMASLTATSAFLCLRTSIHPLWLLVAGALAGYLFN
ncbi:MAG: chromate transporter [Acidocella sp.]|nr:chromate transporter [Acidocella sp.]